MALRIANYENLWDGPFSPDDRALLIPDSDASSSTLEHTGGAYSFSPRPSEFDQLSFEINPVPRSKFRPLVDAISHLNRAKQTRNVKGAKKKTE